MFLIALYNVFVIHLYCS